MKQMEGKRFENLSHEGTSFEDLMITDCIFYRCNFMELQLTSIRFRYCEFHNCVVGGIDFADVSMSNCSFYSCMLVGIDWKELGNAALIPFDVIQLCSLQYNYFQGMKLMNFSFAGSKLEGCGFSECNLEGASFNGCNLRESLFLKNNLAKCDFRGAEEYSFDVRENKVKKARFTLTESVGLLKAFEIELE